MPEMGFLLPADTARIGALQMASVVGPGGDSGGYTARMKGYYANDKSGDFFGRQTQGGEPASPHKSQAIYYDLREADWDCVGLESRFGQYEPIQPSRNSSPALSQPASRGVSRRCL
jgi:hypothetical protein